MLFERTVEIVESLTVKTILAVYIKRIKSNASLAGSGEDIIKYE